MQLRDIYIALVNEGENFNPAIHARRDLDIVDVRLKKADEGSFWSAEVDILNPGGGMFRPGAKRRAIISYRNAQTGGVHHALTGRLEAWPIGLAHDVLTITIVAAAKTEDREDLEDQALAGVEDDPWALFRRGDLTERRKPEERLSARSAMLNYGRRDSNPPVLTDIIEGVGFLDLGGKFVEGSLEFGQPQQPVTRVEVTLSAEWLQSVLALIDVASQLPNAGVFTMIGYPEWDAFPRLGERIGDWAVVRSALTNPVTNLAPYNFNAKSESNPTVDAEGPVDVEVSMKRSSYDFDLVLAAVANARRKETVKFAVQWAGTQLVDTEGLTETIDLSCSNLQGRYQPPAWQAGVQYVQGAEVSADGLAWRCTALHVSGGSIYNNLAFWEPVIVNGFDPTGGVYAGAFFGVGQAIQANSLQGNLQLIVRNSAPGLTAIRYALRQAQAKILKSMRSVTATFEVPWHYVRDLHGSERIRIADASIPGGEMIGKVVSIEYSLVEQLATVTIAAAPGKGGGRGNLGIPTYLVPPLGATGILRAAIVNTFDQQKDIIDAQIAQDPVINVEQLERDIATRFEIEMAPVPRGGNLEITIPMPTVSVDCDTMIDLEADLPGGGA